MAGKNDDNELHQDIVICKGTGSLGGHLGDHIPIFHVSFNSHLAGHLGGCLGGCIAIFHVCFSGHLAGCCASALPGEILYILPKLATMSVLGSWHVYCLGWVIWWSDRNRQGLLTECTFMSLNKCVFM